MSKHKKKKSPSYQPMGWYYMCKDDITVDNIIEAIKEITDQAGYELEVWREVGVIEIVIEEKKSMDIEQCELDLGDEFSNEYIEDYGAKSLFYISFAKDIYKKCEPILLALESNTNGKLSQLD